MFGFTGEAMFSVGDRVRVERDEARYPAKGSWSRFRGRTGTVVEVNRDRRFPELTEHGVVFRNVRTDAKRWSGDDVVWFKAGELRPVAAVRTTRRRNWPTWMDLSNRELETV